MHSGDVIRTEKHVEIGCAQFVARQHYKLQNDEEISIPVFNLGLLFVGSAILEVQRMNSVANPKFFQSRVARSEV